MWLKVSQQARQRRRAGVPSAWSRDTTHTAESERCLRLIGKLVEKSKLPPPPGEILIQAELMEGSTTLADISGKEPASRIVQGQLRMAPGLQETYISREIARRIPTRSGCLVQRSRLYDIAVLEAGHPIAVAHLW